MKRAAFGLALGAVAEEERYTGGRQGRLVRAHPGTRTRPSSSLGDSFVASRHLKLTGRGGPL